MHNNHGLKQIDTYIALSNLALADNSSCSDRARYNTRYGEFINWTEIGIQYNEKRGGGVVGQHGGY